MYCRQCGSEFGAKDRFCSSCGAEGPHSAGSVVEAAPSMAGDQTRFSQRGPGSAAKAPTSVGELIDRMGLLLTVDRASSGVVEPIDLERVDRDLRSGFLCWTKSWGSVVVIHFCDGAGMTPQRLRVLADDLHSTVVSVHSHATTILPGFRLAAFGISCVLFESSIPPDVREMVPDLKRVKFWRKQYSMVWAIDVASEEIVKHKGIPLSMQPRPNYFLDLMRDAAK